MWLIHAGFMAYEAGAARRKNIMSTAMKNILTIAVVTPTFYYFGWYIYGCMEEGWPKNGHDSPDAFPGFCGLTAPWSEGMGPNLQDHVSLVFFLAFLLFSWTTASIMSGALIERVRLSAFLLLAVMLGSVVWILDAAWGWSSGGWLTTRFGFHDSIASGVVHGVAGAFTLGVLLNLGPRIGKYDIVGRARSFRPHNTHMTLMGLMLIFTGFYGFYAACLVIQSTTFPGWLSIYLSPTTLGTIAMVITFGFAGGFTGGWFASQGRPVLDPLRRPRGRDLRVGRRRRLPPVARLPALVLRRHGRASGSATWIEKKLRIDDAVGAVAVHGFSRLLRRLPRRHLRRRLPDRDQQHRELDGRPADGHPHLRPARVPLGLRVQLDPQEANLLRVPPEVEIEGLDMAEFQQDFYPEFERAPEIIIGPDGEELDAGPILLDGYATVTAGRATTRAGS